MLGPLLIALATAGAASESQAEKPVPAASPAPPEHVPQGPRAADPWSILRDTPGVLGDRVDIGGSETGQQSLVVGFGDNGSGATWTLDGIDITDPAALGSTVLFPDVDALTTTVRTRALDVHVRTPGVQIGLFTPPRASRTQGAAHVRAGGLGQSHNLPDELSTRPFFRNRTDSVLEAGAEAGTPRRNGRLWLWGALAVNRLAQETFTGHDERVRTTSLTTRARLALNRGHLSLLAVRGEKTHDERDPTLSTAPEARWRQSGPTTLGAVELAQPWKGLAVSARLSALDAGFRLDPAGGERDVLEDLDGVFQRSFSFFETRRPRLEAATEIAGVRRRGATSHRWLAGLGYRRSLVETRSGWPAGGVLGLERQSVFFRAFRLSGFAQPTRDQHARSLQQGFSAFVQDEMQRGRFTATLGVRVDEQWGRNLASAVLANPVFPELLPAVSYPGADRGVRFRDVLPRLGVGFDASGDGRSVARLWYAAYAGTLGSGDVTFDHPLGREGAVLTYYWNDRNGDHTVQSGELDLVRGRVGASGVDPARPGAAESPHLVAPDFAAPRTNELALALSHDFGEHVHAEVEVGYRRTGRAAWRPLRNLTLADYAIRGAVSGVLVDEPYSVGYYAPASQSRIVPGNGRSLDNRDGYRQDSIGTTLRLHGRASRHLRWQAWGALLDWRERFTNRDAAVQDPTPTESEPLQDGGVVAVRAGGLGRSDVFVNARFTAGLVVEGRLPWRSTLTAAVRARDGFPIPYFVPASTGDPTAGTKNVLVASHLDRHRLPTLVLMDARLQRAIRLPKGELVLGAEAFNLLNRSATLQVARDVELPIFARPREIVRPRLLRLTLDYRF